MIPIRDTVPIRNVPVATWALITVIAGVFVCELALWPDTLEPIFYLFGMVPARYSHPEWAKAIGFPVGDYWPFLTSMFLHNGWLHVIGNIWTLWLFGKAVEDRLGSLRFTIFYLLTGLAAGLVQWLTNADATVPTVGASGAIAGVLGAYFVLHPRSRIITLLPIVFLPLFFELPAIIYFGLWFLTQVYSGTLSGLGPHHVGGVAWWAHVGGFVAGVALLRLFLLPQADTPADASATNTASTMRGTDGNEWLAQPPSNGRRLSG